MIVGVHSLNQLIYGFALGLWTLVWVLTYWRPLVQHHIYLIKNRILDSKELKQLLVFVGCLCFLALITLTVVYAVATAEYVMPAKYERTLKKCNPAFNMRELDQENLYVCGIVMLPFGIYSGLAFRYYKLEAVPDPEDEGRSLIHDNCKSFGSAIKSILSLIIVLLPGAALFIVFGALKDHVDPYVAMIFGCAVPAWGIGFLLFGGFMQLLVSKCS